MKRFLLISAILVAATFNSVAQSYKQLLTDGKMWKCATKGDHFSSCDATFTVTVVGDTIVNGRTCKNLHYEGVKENGKVIDFNRAAYEEDGKVYTNNLDFYFEWGEDFIPVIDFNMHKGDLTDDGQNQVEADDYAMVDGEKVHRVKMNCEDRNGVSPVWVEGVGPNTDYILFTMPTVIPTTTGYSAIDYMLECYDNGKLIYTADDFNKGWDTDGIALPTADKAANGTLYDITGKPCKAPRKGDIYIKDGKKVLME